MRPRPCHVTIWWGPTCAEWLAFCVCDPGWVAGYRTWAEARDEALLHLGVRQEVPC